MGVTLAGFKIDVGDPPGSQRSSCIQREEACRTERLLDPHASRPRSARNTMFSKTKKTRGARTSVIRSPDERDVIVKT